MQKSTSYVIAVKSKHITDIQTDITKTITTAALRVVKISALPRYV